MLKKWVLVCLLLIGAMGAAVYSVGAERTVAMLKQPFQTQSQYEQQLIQDWLHYDQMRQQFVVPQLDNSKIDLQSEAGRKAFTQNYVRYSQKIVAANQQNIQKMQQVKFLTESYRSIQSLDIQALEVMSQLLQTHVIDYSAKHGDTETFLSAPALELETRSKYQQQQTEIQVLNQLRVLHFKKDKRLKEIDQNLFLDWLDFTVLEHQLYPRDAEWDTLKNLQKMTQRNRQDDFRELNAYQALQLRTETFKQIQAMTVQRLQETLDIFKDVAKPTNLQQAQKSLEQLNQILKQQDFKGSVQLSERLAETKQKVNRQIMQQLAKSFL